MKIYSLTITRETPDKFAEVTTTLYANPEDAIEMYGKVFDEAMASYVDAWIDDEVVTDTPYRWLRICDTGGSYGSITIELDAKEVM